MGGRAPPVEKARRRQNEGACTNRDDASAAMPSCLEAVDRFMGNLGIEIIETRNDDRLSGLYVA